MIKPGGGANRLWLKKFEHSPQSGLLMTLITKQLISVTSLILLY